MILSALNSYVYAQIPQKMSFQAVIRNSNNVLLTNSTIGMRISILQGSETGIVVYSEEQKLTTNDFGLINSEIGNNADFRLINWSISSFFIKTEFDPEGETNYTISGVQKILSVPYSLLAESSEIFSNLTQSQIDAITPTVGQVFYNSSTKNLVLYNGTAYKNIVTQSINAGSFSIGQSYQGGTIFYLDATGKHGLIAAPADIQAVKWCVGTSYLSTGATGTAIGTGQANTATIIATQGVGSYAAQACAEYVAGGYTDWYLPSSEELKVMYTNAAQFLGMNTTTRYWSSTETPGDLTYGKALAVRWSDGVLTVGNNKDFYYPARAIRSF